MYFVQIVVFIGFQSVVDFILGHGLIFLHYFEKISPRDNPPHTPRPHTRTRGTSIIHQVVRTS